MLPERLSLLIGHCCALITHCSAVLTPQPTDMSLFSLFPKLLHTFNECDRWITRNPHIPIRDLSNNHFEGWNSSCWNHPLVWCYSSTNRQRLFCIFVCLFFNSLLCVVIGHESFLVLAKLILLIPPKTMLDFSFCLIKNWWWRAGQICRKTFVGSHVLQEENHRCSGAADQNLGHYSRFFPWHLL